MYEIHTLPNIYLPVNNPANKKEVELKRALQSLLLDVDEKGGRARCTDTTSALTKRMSDNKTDLPDDLLAERIIRTSNLIDAWEERLSTADAAEVRAIRMTSDDEEETGVRPDIGSLIYRIRRYQDIDQDALADRAGIDVEILFAIELGRAPDWIIEENLGAIGEALEVDLGALYKELIDSGSA